MTIYSDEQKINLIARMLSPQNADVPQLSKESGIPKGTLYGWRRQALQERGLRLAPAGARERWNRKEKFAMVVETAAPLVFAVAGKMALTGSHYKPTTKRAIFSNLTVRMVRIVNLAV